MRNIRTGFFVCLVEVISAYYKYGLFFVFFWYRCTVRTRSTNAFVCWVDVFSTECQCGVVCVFGIGVQYGLVWFVLLCICSQYGISVRVFFVFLIEVFSMESQYELLCVVGICSQYVVVCCFGRCLQYGIT